MSLINAINKLFNNEPDKTSYSGIEISEFGDKLRDDEFFDAKSPENIGIYRYTCKKYNIEDQDLEEDTAMERERSRF